MEPKNQNNTAEETEEQEKDPGQGDQNQQPPENRDAGGGTKDGEEGTEKGASKEGKQANAAGSRSVEDFDPDDETNSGQTFTMTGAALKARLARQKAQIEGRHQREKEAAEAAAAEERRKVQEKELETERKFQELAETRLTRISELETKVRELETKVTGLDPYQAAVKSVLDERRKLVPEAYRELLNDLPELKQLDWIKRNEARLLQESGAAKGTEGGETQGSGTNGAANGKTQSRQVPKTPQADTHKGIPDEERKRLDKEYAVQMRRAF